MAISIAEAREILGSEADGLSDEQVGEVLAALYAFAAELLDMQEEGEL